MANPLKVTCIAPVNIAVVKYWGKRDEKLILPVNSSLSATLNTAELKTTTTIMASKDFPCDQMWLNGKEQKLDSVRLQNCLRELRKRATDKKNANGEVIVKSDEWDQYKLRIASVNNFPTAAGLASSASGFACLVYTLAQLYGIKESFPGELSLIARQGSGSACRSMYGGFVAWEAGTKDDGSDSFAVQIADENHWPEIVILVLVVSANRKPIGSTDAMQLSVQTSDLLKYRASCVVPERMTTMIKAIKEKDFETFARETIRDSNQFHAICLDTYPPVFYMNDTSKQIIRVLTRFNEASGRLKAAYTYDAGPNCVIYTLKEYEKEVMDVINYYFPLDDSQTDLPEDLKQKIGGEIYKGALERIIRTTVGSGPQVVGPENDLLDDNGQLISN